jgi:hypothetical protein
MTTTATDVITALKEDIELQINTVSELNNKSIYVYDPAQLSAAHTRLSLPCVIFHYSGMRHIGKKHDVVFDMYLVAKAESLNQVQGLNVVPTATELLQKLRKAMACNTSATTRAWNLESELPSFGVDDKLIYRQRWVTAYQIIL